MDSLNEMKIEYAISRESKKHIKSHLGHNIFLVPTSDKVIKSNIRWDYGLRWNKFTTD